MTCILPHEYSSVKFNVTESGIKYSGVCSSYIINDTRIAIGLVESSRDSKRSITIACVGYTVIINNFKVTACGNIAIYIQRYISVTVKYPVEYTSCIGD